MKKHDNSLMSTGMAMAASSPYAASPPRNLGNSTIERISPDLETILGVLRGAVQRIKSNNQELIETLSRVHGSWPVEMEDPDMSADRDGIIPAIAAACDDLHRAIDRMRGPIEVSRKL